MAPLDDRSTVIPDKKLVLSDMKYDATIQALRGEVLNNHSLLVVVNDMQRDIEVVLNLFRDLEFTLAGYVTLNKTKSFINQALKVKKIDTSKFFYIDGITRALSEVPKIERDGIFLEDPQSLDELDNAIENVLKKDPDFIIFDSISSLLAYHDASDIVGFFEKFLERARSSKTKIILIISKVDWDKHSLQRIGDLADKIVVMMLDWGYTWPKR